MAERFKILLVDDDPAIRTLSEGVLERAGMITRAARSAEAATAELDRFDADLIVLDLMMEGEDGLSFCRRLRARSNVPIIMLTALAEDIDRIVGLEVGADDYLAKPFNPRELVARIKSVLRRTHDRGVAAQPTREALRFDDFVMVPEAMTLERAAGERVHLTTGEFALLLALVERAPRVLSRDQLLDILQGGDAESFDRSIDSQVSRLRSKIERDARRPELIKTVRNLGYAFAAPVRRE